MVRHARAAGLAAAAVLAALLAGCGDDAVLSHADAAVAVHVNAGGIPVTQIRTVLRRQPQLLADQPDTATAQVLEVLVDQELAAQAATDQGLDRDPEVLQALALARREVLARAFQERLAATAAQPGRGEIDRYRDAHPLLFSQRRLYTIQEFVIDPGTPAQAGLLALIARRARSADEVAGLLHEAGFAHHTRRFAHAAEDLPPPLLEPLANLEHGQSLALAAGSQPRILTVLDAQAAPVAQPVADAAIAAHLAAERQRLVVAPAMRALRDAAQISYRGVFAKAPVVAPRLAPAASAPAG